MVPGGMPVKVRDLMVSPAVCTEPGQSVESAARVLHRYNVGALPVCTSEGRLCGMITDRDLVVRCLANGLAPEKTQIRQVMSRRVISVDPETDASVAAHLMGRKGVRRLPVVSGGRVLGILSIEDLTGSEQNAYDAADALGEIRANYPDKNS